MSKIIVIVGPTGVGKTKLSIALAKRYSAEIINGDSVQVYKEMNIGSAKVSNEEMEGVKHHLIDIKDVYSEYTVYDYQKDGREVINRLIKDNKNIIIVGGTGLYIKALLYDYKFEEIKEFNNYDNYTNEELYNLVIEKDKNANIHINNRKRLISFLNRVSSTNNGNNKVYDFSVIGLTTNRDNLYTIINNRVDKMISDGLIDEVKNLYLKYPNSRILNSAIGYKELIEYFNGDVNLECAIDKVKQNSRRYAKRQYTFFNNQMDVKWFLVNYDNFDNTINEVIEYIDLSVK